MEEVTMGSKLWFTGATFLLALSVWNPFDLPQAPLVGAVLMVFGIVLMWMNK